MEMETGGFSCAVAMPPAPTAAIMPTPRTAPLRAMLPPRCLATLCRPRTGRTDSAVGFHSSRGGSSSSRAAKREAGTALASKRGAVSPAEPPSGVRVSSVTAGCWYVSVSGEAYVSNWPVSNWPVCARSYWPVCAAAN